jgi:protein-tyrosine phosphatase
MPSILVVCSGNLCRSPIAEAILRSLLTERFGSAAPSVSSAGTIARRGAPATEDAILVAAEHGLDASSHAATVLEAHVLGEPDLILAMAAEHRDEISALDPTARSRTFTLKELVGLLEQLPPAAVGAGLDSLATRVRDANALRRDGSPPGPADEDVADPIGHPLETYRAVAWEIASWSRRLIESLFGPKDAISETDSRTSV